jgi:hypothetical protein
MVANYAREVGEAIFPSGGSVNFKTGRHKGERGSRPDPAAGTGDDDAPC